MSHLMSWAVEKIEIKAAQSHVVGKGCRIQCEGDHFPRGDLSMISRIGRRRDVPGWNRRM